MVDMRGGWGWSRNGSIVKKDGCGLWYLPFSRSDEKWLWGRLSFPSRSPEAGLHGWWWRGAWLTHALAKENLWCPRHWVVSFPFLGSGFSRSFGKHLTHESENTIIPIILLESLDKQGYMCYNTVVLISYQEQLGCYDKVATYRSVPQSSDDRVPRSSSLYVDNELFLLVIVIVFWWLAARNNAKQWQCGIPVVVAP